MHKRIHNSRRKPLFGLCGALVALFSTVGFGEEIKSTAEDKGGAKSLIGSVGRIYAPSFLEALGNIESPDPGKLPEPRSGMIEVILPTVRGNEQFRVTLNTSQQVFTLSTPLDVELTARDPRNDREISPGLTASMAASGVSNKFRSASMLAFKAKQFDDGLYASVELAANQGVGKFASLRVLLADMAAALAASQSSSAADQALGLLAAATKLSGLAVDVPTGAAMVAASLEQEFLGNPLRSKPIGFYTWSQDLVGIFQRDRLLQTSLEVGDAKAFAGALGNDAELLARYRHALRLTARLTNGFASEALAGVAAVNTPALNGMALFPPSQAYEATLIEKLYGNTPIPQGFNLADEMVRRIQSGELSLEPGEDSGWYDYQTYALEPLVIPNKLPEARHLRLEGSYENELVKLFKALLTMTRETHVKQLVRLSAGAAGPPPGIVLKLRPQLTQEPLATFYLRRALAYRFVRGVLVECFGNAGLAAIRRLTTDGPINLTLDRELRVMESLFYGAYLNTAYELGMNPEKQTDLGLGEARSLALYRSWKPEEDPDVSADMRMMVPVFYDIERGKTKVWVVLGVTYRPLQVHYSTPPILESVVDMQGKPVDLAKVELRFERTKFPVAYPVMAELYVTKILNREELRALCDEHKTPTAILEHLR